MTAPLLITIAIVVPIVIWVPEPYNYWLTVLIPLVLLSQWTAYRMASWHVTDRQLTIQSGHFARHIYFIPKKGIQWCQQEQSIWQERRDVASFKLVLISGKDKKEIELQHAATEDVATLMNWTRKKHKEA